MRARPIPPQAAALVADGRRSAAVPGHSRRARGVCRRDRRRQAGWRPATSSRDDDERLCQPLARATPARVAEAASRCAAGRDRHRQRARSAGRRRRCCHSLCHQPGSADGWHRRGAPERYLLARLQSALAFTGAPEETCRPRKARLDPLLLVAGRPRAAHVAEMARRGPSAGGATCPNSRTCST